MNLAIDVDGVLRDFCGSLILQFSQDFPDKAHEIEPIVEWDLHKFFPIGKAIYDYAFKAKAKPIFENADPFDGAIFFADRLKSAGHHVCLLTQQPYGNEQYTLNWLHKWKIPYDSIVFSARKEMFEYDFLLDDAEHNLRAVREVGKRAICFDQAWNQKWDGERIRSYNEFLELIANGKHS